VNANYVDGLNGYNVEVTEFGNCFGTEEFKEGTTAFLEKRKAEFK
jgi:enoyl-CoA hydratase